MSNEKVNGQPPASPECEKVSQLKGANNTVGDFIEHLMYEGFAICERHEHTGPINQKGEGCGDKDDRYGDTGRECGAREGEMIPSRKRTEEWIAEYFEIDLAKMHREQNALLAWVQAQQKD